MCLRGRSQYGQAPQVRVYGAAARVPQPHSGHQVYVSGSLAHVEVHAVGTEDNDRMTEEEQPWSAGAASRQLQSDIDARHTLDTPDA